MQEKGVRVNKKLSNKINALVGAGSQISSLIKDDLNKPAPTPNCPKSQRQLLYPRKPYTPQPSYFLTSWGTFLIQEAAPSHLLGPLILYCVESIGPAKISFKIVQFSQILGRALISLAMSSM